MRACVVFEPCADRARLLDFLAERYGMAPAVFDDFTFWCRPGAPSIWMTTAALELPPGPHVEALGVLVMRKPPPAGKPTSTFLMRMGGHATRQALDLDDAGAAAFLRRESLDLSATAVDGAEGVRGYCVVRDRIGVIGCGFVQGGVLRSELPRAWTEGVESDG